jgi:ABC-2 type transport system ATP-binding protein
VIALDSPDALKARAASDRRPEPTMEDAFIALIEAADTAAREAA